MDPPPPLLLPLLKLMWTIIWSLLSAQTSLAQFTIPGGVHYHWHWDEQEQRYIKRVYESHENYTFTELKLPPRASTVITEYVLIASLAFCCITGLLGGGYIVIQVIQIRKDRLEAERVQAQQAHRKMMARSNGNYALFENVDYTLLSVLGEGKFGTVWHAIVEPKAKSEDNPQQNPQQSPRTATDVAIKVFTGLKNVRSLEMERYVYELPGMKSAPNILRFLGIFEVRFPPDFEYQKKDKDKDKKDKGEEVPPRIFWLITEYHPTGSLYDYLSGRRFHPASATSANLQANQYHPLLTVDQLVTLAHGLASGVSFLHNFRRHQLGWSLSVALRDLKSANIILALSGDGDEPGKFRPLIADFGLAIAFNSASADAVCVGDARERVGTPRYMAPEVLSGHLDLARSGGDAFLAVDMYALSLVLWELVSRTKLDGGEEDYPENYRPPYQEFLGDRIGPSVAAMHSLVVGRRLRPTLKTVWFETPVVRVVAEAMVDCWDVDGDARLKAATLLLRMEALLKVEKVKKVEEKKVEEVEVYEV